jgi:hypothetical protein
MTSHTHSRILCTTNTASPDEDAVSIVPTKQLEPGEPVPRQSVAEPESAYGCVDWYLYPDTRQEAS